MKTPTGPLTRSHFHPLCVTGGMQPYTKLQSAYREEQAIMGNPGIEPQFLDAPCFTGAGYTALLDFADRPAVTHVIIILEGRL